MKSEAVNIGRRLFVDETGETFPITNLFDADGEECDAPDAVSAVAGTEGRWFVLDLSEFNAGAYQ